MVLCVCLSICLIVGAEPGRGKALQSVREKQLRDGILLHLKDCPVCMHDDEITGDFFFYLWENLFLTGGGESFQGNFFFAGNGETHSAAVPHHTLIGFRSCQKRLSFTFKNKKELINAQKAS